MSNGNTPIQTRERNPAKLVTGASAADRQRALSRRRIEDRIRDEVTVILAKSGGSPESRQRAADQYAESVRAQYPRLFPKSEEPDKDEEAPEDAGARNAGRSPIGDAPADQSSFYAAEAARQRGETSDSEEDDEDEEEHEPAEAGGKPPRAKRGRKPRA